MFYYYPQRQQGIETSINSHCDICGDFAYNLKQTKKPKKFLNHNTIWNLKKIDNI